MSIPTVSPYPTPAPFRRRRRLAETMHAETRYSIAFGSSPRRPKVGSASGIVAAGVALSAAWLLAIAAQINLVRLPPALEIPASLASRIAPMWPHAGPAAYAIVEFLLAMAFFAGVTTRTLGVPPFSTIQFNLWRRGVRRPFGLALFAVGLCLFVWDGIGLATRPYSPELATWFFASVALALAGMVAYESERIRWRLQRGPLVRIIPELFVVVGFAAAFLGLNRVDLGSWYYSAIGDEYGFFDVSRAAAVGAGTPNLFSQDGVFGYHPILSTYLRGILMRAVGLDVVGWKLSLAVIVAGALVVTYLLARSMYGRRVAILTLGMLATAHYLYAFVHTGYNNLEPLLPAAGALLCFILGVRYRSATLLFTSGILAGFGWYTFYSGRAMIVVIGAILVVTINRQSWRPTAASILGGFLWAVTPLVIVNKLAVITQMIGQTAAGSNEAVANKALLPYWNLGRSLLAFNYNAWSGHYTWGSLAEPLTGLLFVLGLGYAIATIPDPRSRLLLAWFGLTILVDGVLSQYDQVTITRMHFALPVVALLAALAVDRTLATIGVLWEARARRLMRPQSQVGSGAGQVASYFAVGVVLVVVTYGNLDRWFVQTPAHFQSSQEALIVEAVLLPACASAAQIPLVVNAGVPVVLAPALNSLTAGQVKVQVVLYNENPSWIETANARCVIFHSPNEPPAQSLGQRLHVRWPELLPTPVYDRAHKAWVLVFTPPVAT